MTGQASAASINGAGAGVGSESVFNLVSAENDQYLHYMVDVLNRLHAKYYEKTSHMAVPLVLRQMRLDVFGRRAKFVFSGLILKQRGQEMMAKPDESASRQDIQRYAEDLGATVGDEVDKTVTRVVSRKDKRGTEKCMEGAKVPGCAVVTAEWLLECVWRLRRVPVNDYLLYPVAKVEERAKESSLSSFSSASKRKRHEVDDQGKDNDGFYGTNNNHEENDNGDNDDKSGNAGADDDSDDDDDGDDDEFAASLLDMM